MAKLTYEIHLDVAFIKKMMLATEELLFIQIFDNFDELESILNASNITWQE
jgi:hypothetical protein